MKGGCGESVCLPQTGGKHRKHKTLRKTLRRKTLRRKTLRKQSRKTHRKHKVRFQI